MNTFVPKEEPSEYATMASRLKIWKGFSADAVAWITPWAIIGSVFLVMPSVLDSTFLVVLLTTCAALCSGIALAVDIRSLKGRGYTTGLMKQDIRVIDPELDETLWQARLIPKSLVKLLRGKYEFLDISQADQSGSEP